MALLDEKGTNILCPLPTVSIDLIKPASEPRSRLGCTLTTLYFPDCL